MRFTTASLSLALAALATSEEAINAVPSSWDGHCYYPKADIGFQLESYLGKWFQVAGTVAPFTAGCKCIQAQYSLNVSLSYSIHTHAAPSEEKIDGSVESG